MEQFLIGLLIGFSNLFGVAQGELSSKWATEKYWTKENDIWLFQASSSSIINDCSEGKSIEFPQVVHGVHLVWADEKLVLKSGDQTFKKSSSFYERPSLQCELLSNVKEIRWQVRSYSQFFAKIKEMPVVRENKFIAKSEFFNVTLNLTCATVLMMFLLLSAFLLAGKIDKEYYILLSSGGISFVIYSLSVVADRVGINISMLTAHKIADIFVWLGATSYFYFFMIRNFISRRIFLIFTGFLTIALVLLLLGSNPDIVQLGTVFPMPIAAIILITFLVNLIHGYKIYYSRMMQLEFISALLFILISLNDLLNILNFKDGYMMLPLVSIIVFFHIAAIANANIENSFRQNETLMNELKSKHMLEQIAHDIRSPLSVISLLVPSFVSQPSSEKANLLVQATEKINAIAFSLLKSKDNSYLHITPFKIVNSINSLLREKEIELGANQNIALQVEDVFDMGTQIKVHEVEFVRMLSNLINNSIFAVNEIIQPKIEIILNEKQGNVIIEIRDNGKGIPSSVLSNLGKRGFSYGKAKAKHSGAGLGLFHAKTFVKENSGQFKITSTSGVGCVVTIILSKYY